MDLAPGLGHIPRVQIGDVPYSHLVLGCRTVSLLAPDVASAVLHPLLRQPCEQMLFLALARRSAARWTEGLSLDLPRRCDEGETVRFSASRRAAVAGAFSPFKLDPDRRLAADGD